MIVINHHYHDDHPHDDDDAQAEEPGGGAREEGGKDLGDGHGAEGTHTGDHNIPTMNMIRDALLEKNGIMWEIFPNREDLTQFFPVVSMIALLVPEISPGVGFCDEDGGIGYSSSWIGKRMTSQMTMTVSKTHTKTNTKCLKDPSHDIFS